MRDRNNDRKVSVRLSEVLCPEYPPSTDDTYKIFSADSNSSQPNFNFTSSYNSTQATKVRDELVSGKYNRLTSPILGDRSHVSNNQGNVDEQSSSFASSNLINNKRNLFNCLKLASKLSSVLTTVGFAAQTLCFILLLIHVDHNHTLTYGIVLAVSAIGSLGVIFGLWNLLVNHMKPPKYYTRLAYMGSGCFVLHLIVALSFALGLSEQKLIESIGALDDGFFKYDILCIFLASLLVIELLTVITILRTASQYKKLHDLENIHKKKSEILSQIARDLAVS